MSVGVITPVRLLPMPSDGARTPYTAHRQDLDGEWASRASVGITFSLPDTRSGTDLGPVVSHVLPGSVADADGKVRAGDCLVSIDGETVKTWSMAKVRRVISSRVSDQVSLEFDRCGEKILAKLSRGALGAVSAPLGVALPDTNVSGTLSLSALNERADGIVMDGRSPSVSRIGGSNVVLVEQLQVRCKELSAGKAALELKISDLLSKEKMQTTKMAAAERDLQRSKALTVNLTKELQVMQEKCIKLERENAELSSQMKTLQSTKTQIVERARQNEDALRESEKSLVDMQAHFQEVSRALDSEKRACALLQSKMAHTQELLTIEKKRREESETKAIQVQTLEEEMAVLKQNIRQKEMEGLEKSQRTDRSSAQLVEMQCTIGQLQHDLDAIRQEKTTWLDERLELRRAVSELENIIHASRDLREPVPKASRNSWTGVISHDNAGAPTSVTLGQRVYELTLQIKNLRLEHAEAISTSQDLDSKYVGLVQTNNFFRHRIEDVQGLVASLVSDLHESRREAENILQEASRMQSALLRERNEAHTSLERCGQLRASAEDRASGIELKFHTLEIHLEKSEEANRRAAAELDLLRRTIPELEVQYRELQAQTQKTADNLADELRSAKKEVLRLQAELSQEKTLHTTSLSNVENKETARLMAVKERDEAEKRLKEIRAIVAALELELRSAEKEREALEEHKFQVQELEQIKSTLSDQMHLMRNQLTVSDNTISSLQGQLKGLRELHERVVAEKSEANKRVSELQLNLIELRHLLTSTEAEIENLQTINHSMYTEKTNASEDVARLSQQYRDVKQEEAHLIASLAETRLFLSEKEQLASRLSEEWSRSREQHAVVVLQVSELQYLIGQLQHEAGEIQQQLVISEESFRSRYAEVSRKNRDLQEMIKTLNGRQALYAQSEREHSACIKTQDEKIRSLQDAVALLTQTNMDLGQHNMNLESELDQQLGKLQEAKVQLSNAKEELISWETKEKETEFEKFCLAHDREIAQKSLQSEFKSRSEAEDVARKRALEIYSLNDKNSALEGKLQEITEAKVAVEILARESGEQVTILTQSNRVLIDELQAVTKDLQDAESQSRVLQESQKNFEGSLHQTKAAFETEQTKSHKMSAELQIVTKQREWLREEFITMSQKYKTLINETDKLADSLDHRSQNQLAQTIRAGDVMNQGMEHVRHDFEDDMLKMALDLKDLMHNHYAYAFESPGGDTPERRGLYRTLTASVVDPRNEIKAIGILGIAKSRIQELEDHAVERANDLAQSNSALARVHAKQAESESALLASKQKQEAMEQEIEALSASQRQMHSQAIKIRAEYEHTRELLERRNQELADAMRELKVEQAKSVAAALRDGTLSEEMTGLRKDYHDAIEAYKVSEMRWTKKVLEAETKMANVQALETAKNASEVKLAAQLSDAKKAYEESVVETANLHLKNFRALETAKRESEAILTAQLNDAKKAYEDSEHKYEITKAAWDEEIEELDLKLKDALQDNKFLHEQNDAARLAHKGLIIQLEECETQISAAKTKNEKLIQSSKVLEDQAKLDQDTIAQLRVDFERNKQQNLEIEGALDKVQDSCRHQALRIIDFEEEVLHLKKLLAEGDVNLEKVTSAYQDLTYRFNLGMKRELEAVTKIDLLENRMKEHITLSEQLQSKVIASDSTKDELNTIIYQQTLHLQDKTSQNENLQNLVAHKFKVAKRIVIRMEIMRISALTMAIWKEAVAKAVEEKKEFNRLQSIKGVIVRRVLYKHMFAAYMQWYQNVVEQKQMAYTARKTVLRLANKCLVKTLHAWLECLKLNKRCCKMIRRLINRNKIAAYNRWRQEVVEKKTQARKARKAVLGWANQWLVKTMDAWHECWKLNKLKRDLMLRIARRFRRRRFFSAFQQWNSNTASALTKRNLMIRIAQRLRRRRFVSAFELWYSNTASALEQHAEKKRLASVCLKMMRWLINRKKIAAYNGWRQKVMGKKSKAIKARKAFLRWANQWLVRAMDAWHECWKLNKLKCDLMLRIAQRLRRRRFVSAFELWYSNTASALEQHAEKKRLASVCLKMMRRLMNRNKMAAYNGWRQKVVEKKSKTIKARKSFLRWANQWLVKAMGAWHECWKLNKLKRDLMLRIAQRFRRRRFVSAFELWYSNTASALEQHAEKERQVSVCRRMMRRLINRNKIAAYNGWRQKVVEEKTKAYKERKAMLGWANQWLVKAMDAWHECWKLNKLKRDLMLRIAQRFRRRRFVSAFELWYSNTASALEQHAEKERQVSVCLKMMRRLINRNKIAAYTRWHWYIVERKIMFMTGQRAVLRLANKRFAKSIATWHRQTLENKHGCNLIEKMARRLSSRCIFGASERWKENVKFLKAKHFERGRLESVGRKLTLRLLKTKQMAPFLHWHQAVVVKKFLANKALKAVLRRLNLRIASAFEIWVDYVQTLRYVRNGGLATAFDDIVDNMEMTLELLQPVIDEVTYHSADISMLRDGFMAWLKSEERLAHQITVIGRLQDENEASQREHQGTQSELRKMHLHINLIEGTLREEREGRIRTNVSLAEATSRVNELQVTVQEYHNALITKQNLLETQAQEFRKDLTNKQRLITYLEHEHSVQHKSLTELLSSRSEHEVNIMEKESVIKQIDVSWQQDKSQLMRTESAFENLANRFNANLEYSNVLTDVMLGIDNEVLRLSAVVEDCALCCSEIMSLRYDKQLLTQQLQAAQQLLAQEESKVTVFSQVLTTWQENNRRLEAAQAETAQELQDVSMAADLLKVEYQQTSAQDRAKMKMLAADLSSKENLVSVLQGQLETLQKLSISDADEKGRLQESLSAMYFLQARLAQTETELDRFQKSYLTMQAEITYRFRECRQVEAYLRGIEESLNALENANETSRDATIQLVENLKHQNDSLLFEKGKSELFFSETDRLVKELQLSYQEVQQLKEQAADAEEVDILHSRDVQKLKDSLFVEQAEHSKTKASLGDASNKIKELQDTLQGMHMEHQGTLQGMQTDMLGKMRYIAYLEEQQTSLHGSIIEHQTDKRAIEKELQEDKAEIQKNLIERDDAIKTQNLRIRALEVALDAVESTLNCTLTDSRRVRHELLKNMAENVDLRERLANIEAEHGIAVSCESLQGAVIDALEGHMAAIFTRLHEASVFVARQSSELNECKRAVLQLENSLNYQKSAVAQLETSFSNLQFQLNTSLTEKDVLTSKVLSLQSENHSTQKLLSILENQIQALNNNLVQKETENQRQASENQIQASHIAELQMQNDSRFLEISMWKSRLNECAGPMAEFKANAESSEHMVQLAVSKMESLEAKIVQSDGAVVALRDELKEARDNLKKSHILMAEYKANAESSEQIVQLAASKIERLEAIIVQSDAAGEALRDELQEARDNLKRSQILLGDWQGNVHGFESETVSASKIIAHLHDQVSVMHKQIAQHIADKSALEARLKVMNDIHHEGQEQLETIKRGLALDRQEISSLQKCNAKLGRALDNSNQAHHQMLSALEIIGDKFFTLVQKLSDSLYHTSTDNVYLNSEVSRLESEYEEEQQLSSMLQTQVQTLHAVVK